MTHVEPPGRALTLEQYAGVTAALAEGVDLEAVLDQEQLDAKVWRTSSIEWKARLVEDAPQGELFTTYCRTLARAEDCLARKVIPLDADPVAWVGFLISYSKGADPPEMLRSLDLGPNDLARLARLWEGRARTDGQIRARMAAAAAKEPPPLKGIRAEQRALRRFPWSPEPLKKAPQRPAPPPPDTAVPDEPEEVEAASLQVPSFMNPGVHVRPMVPLAVPAADRPVQKPRSTTAPGLVLPTRASVPFRPGAAPPEIATSQGPPKKDDAPAKRVSLGETQEAFQLPKTLPLPFKKSEPALPARTPLDSTSLDLQLPIKRALPFEPGKSAATSAGRTDAPPASRTDTPPAPGTKAPGAQSPAALSLEQHAAMSLELAVLPRHVPSILHRYGIDAATRTELDARYRDLVAESPQARAAWHRAYHAHYEKWHSRR